MIKQYLEPRGAIVKMESRPGKGTYAGIVLEWVEKLQSGVVFKIQELREGTNLTQDEIDKAMKNKMVKETFAAMKTEKRGYYKVE